MAICIICNQRKGKRHCPAKSAIICSLCCGEERGVTITCPPDCSHFVHGDKHQKDRAVEKLASEAVQALTEDQDPFKTNAGAMCAFEFESFLIKKYYNDRTVNDEDVFRVLANLYAASQGDDGYQPANQVERDIATAYETAIQHIPENERDRIVPRMLPRLLRSIKYAAGGITGPRDYFELIFSQRAGTGPFADFSDDD